MYSTITCNKDCAFQKEGNCCKTTTTLGQSNKNESCVFFSKKEVKKKNNEKFWSELIQNYYNKS